VCERKFSQKLLETKVVYREGNTPPLNLLFGLAGKCGIRKQQEHREYQAELRELVPMIERKYSVRINRDSHSCLVIFSEAFAGNLLLSLIRVARFTISDSAIADSL